MRVLVPGLAVLAIGCKEDRVIPMWSDGVLLEGDCHDDYEIVNEVSVLTKVEMTDSDELWHMDTLPDPMGVVVTDEQAYHDTWVNMNFGEWPIVDFTVDQAVFVWTRNTDTCGISIDEWKIGTKADLGLVVDVQYFDESMNCPSSCGEDWKGLLMVAIEKDREVSMCRRTRPGCLPESTAR